MQKKKREMAGQGSVVRGFTLVELLVVMSIISILISILMPALSRAREQGQRVHCMSNLKSLAMAWNLYAEDNEGKTCSPSTFWNDDEDDNYWVAQGPDWASNDIGNTEQALRDGVLWPYTQFLGLYKCRRDLSDLLCSYSMSGAGRRLHEISRSSEKLLFVDASSSFKWIHGSYAPIYRRLIDRTPIWHSWHHCPCPCVCKGRKQQITARHANGCNMIFADFHCEHFKWQDPRTIRFANREIPAEEAYFKNHDIKRLRKVLSK
jgi:prepilin-type N-terminal cleavage/methylation domain-containing protein/prepilin-type processing-associated H-X9-DG protein